MGLELAVGAGGWGTVDNLSLRLVRPAEAQTPTLTMDGALTLGTTLRPVFRLNNSGLEDLDFFYVEVEYNGVVSRYGEGQDHALIPAVYNGITLGYDVNFAGIAATEMGKPIFVQAHGFRGDEEFLSEPIETSVQSYIIDRLTAPNASDKMKTLAADLLNYGAAAQIYFQVDPDALVNENVSDDVKALIEKNETKETPIVEQINTAFGDGPDILLGTTLGDEIVIGLNALLDNPPAEVKVLVTETASGALVAELPTTVSYGRLFSAQFANNAAEKMRTQFDFVLVDGNGAALTQTATWSLEGYVNEVRSDPNSSAARIDLLNAMLVYGDAVTAFIGG